MLQYKFKKIISLKQCLSSKYFFFLFLMILVVYKVNFFSERLYSNIDVKKTSLYDFHIKNEGKMVQFAGYLMPVKYADDITTSHLHTRKSCSLFDVSHMLQTKIYGKHKEKFMEQICVTDVQSKFNEIEPIS